MSNPKCCQICGMQKHYHPSSEYLKIFVKPHNWVQKGTITNDLTLRNATKRIGR